MSDEKQKPRDIFESAPSSALGSSSDSPQSPEQWLEPLLERVTKTIEGSTEAQGSLADSQKAIRDMVSTVFNQVALERQAATSREKEAAQREKRTEQRIADLQVALAGFVGDVQQVFEGLKATYTPAVESRQAQEGVAKAMVTFNERIREASIKFETMTRGEIEGEHASPKLVRVWIVRLTDFAWPHSARIGALAKLYALKLVATAAAALGLGKVLSVYFKHWME